MLATLDDARAQLNLKTSTNDVEVLAKLETATAILSNHPAYRVADVAAVTEHTEWVDAGSDKIVLRHYPVASVTSVAEYPASSAVTLTDAALDGVNAATSNGYVLDAASGIVRRTSGGGSAWFAPRVKVVYTAGSATVPADIREAVLILLENLWEDQRGGEGTGLPSGSEIEEIGGTYGAPYGPSYGLPPRVRELLEPYRREPAVA